MQFIYFNLNYIRNIDIENFQLKAMTILSKSRCNYE